jgi:hypothetical protein
MAAKTETREARVAVVGNIPYAKLVEENAFTPFLRHQ